MTKKILITDYVWPSTEPEEVILKEAGFETGFNPDNGIVVGYDMEGGSITDTVGILTTID